MARHIEMVTGEAIAGQRPEPSAAARRRLRLGPKPLPVIRRPLRPKARGGTADGTVLDKGRALADWHDMTPGQQQAAAVAAALDSGDASAVPVLRDYVLYAGAWWVPASSGWVKVPRPGRAGESFPQGPQISGMTSPAPGRCSDPWQD